MLLHRRVGMDCWDSANWLSRRPAWSYDDGELHDLAQVALGAFWHTLVQEQSRFANYTAVCDAFATQDFLNLNLAKCSLKCVLCVLFLQAHYPYKEHFHGRKRLWEWRIQGHFKRRQGFFNGQPTDSYYCSTCSTHLLQGFLAQSLALIFCRIEQCSTPRWLMVVGVKLSWWGKFGTQTSDLHIDRCRNSGEKSQRRERVSRKKIKVREKVEKSR